MTDEMIGAGVLPTESDEIHLDCPTCGYLLTGLPQDRCPECGIAFDRAQLLLAASPDARRVHPWNDRNTFGLVGSFCRTCMATWFHPGRFAASFPRRHSSRSAWGFSLMCYGVAFAVFLFPMMHFTMGAFMFSGILAAAIGCEWLIALLLSRRFHLPNIPRADAYHFWRGLTHFFSNYVILSAIGATLLLNASGRLFFDLLLFGNRGVIPVAFLWWVFSLSKAVAARTSAEPQLRTGATIMLVLIGLGAIAIGAFLALVGFTIAYARL